MSALFGYCFMTKIIVIFIILFASFSGVARAVAPTPLGGYLYSGHYEPDPISICKYLIGTVTGAAYASAGGGRCSFRNSANEDIETTINYVPYFISEACMPGYGKPDKSKTESEQCPDPVQDDPCKDKNPFVMKYAMSAGGAFPNHVGLCVISVDEVLVCRKETVSSKSTDICMLQLHRTGSKWTAADGDPKNSGTPDNTPEDKNAPKIPIPPTTPSDGSGKCPAGSVQGGSDSSGIPICIGTGSGKSDDGKSNIPTTTTKPPVIVKNADGSTTTTVTTVNTNSDGSTTTSNVVTTVAPDGTVTKSGDTTVGKTPSGESGNSDVDSDFCKNNPNLSICRNSSVSGSCETVTCEGDAIQCATLRAAATLQCRDKEDRDAVKASKLTTDGEAVATGADPLAGTLPSVKNAQVVNAPSSLDATAFLGGGSYFADKTFTIRGQSVTIPFSNTANIMLVFRYALMLVAALVSFKIIRSAVLT